MRSRERGPRRRLGMSLRHDALGRFCRGPHGRSPEDHGPSHHVRLRRPHGHRRQAGRRRQAQRRLLQGRRHDRRRQDRAVQRRHEALRRWSRRLAVHRRHQEAGKALRESLRNGSVRSEGECDRFPELQGPAHPVPPPLAARPPGHRHRGGRPGAPRLGGGGGGGRTPPPLRCRGGGGGLGRGAARPPLAARPPPQKGGTFRAGRASPLPGQAATTEISRSTRAGPSNGRGSCRPQR